jgi:hypothetical protein
MGGYAPHTPRDRCDPLSFLGWVRRSRYGLSGHTERAHALVAQALRHVGAGLAVDELAKARAVTSLRTVAHRSVIRAVERNVRADAHGGGEAASLAGCIARVVATDSIGAEVALAVRGHGARRAIAFLRALRPPTINAGFVAVHHAVTARDAIRLDAGRVCPGLAIGIDDTLDAHAHVVANIVAVAVGIDDTLDAHAHVVANIVAVAVAIVDALDARAHAVANIAAVAVTIVGTVDAHAHAVANIAVAAVRTGRVVHLHRHAVVAHARDTRIAISRRRIAVIVADDDIAHAIANVGLAVVVCRVVDDSSRGVERRDAHTHRAGPVLTVGVRHAVARVVARHAATRAARTACG